MAKKRFVRRKLKNCPFSAVVRQLQSDVWYLVGRRHWDTEDLVYLIPVKTIVGGPKPFWEQIEGVYILDLEPLPF